MLLAQLRGEPSGCGALKFHGTGPAEVKRMWVAARSVGSVSGGASCLTPGRLASAAWPWYGWKPAVLTEAISLSRSAGYVEVPAFNDEPYAHHWFEKRLTAT